MDSLPPGWIDCGQTTEQTLSIDAAPKAGTPYTGFLSFELDGWNLSTASDSTFDNPTDAWTAYLIRPFMPWDDRIRLDTLDSADPPRYHALSTFTKTLGPLRVGVTYEYDTPQDRWRLRYGLFADENTRLLKRIGSTLLSDEQPYSEVTAVTNGLTFVINPNSFLFEIMHEARSAEYVVKVANLTANSAAVSLANIFLPFEVTSTEVAETRIWASGPFAGYRYQFRAPWLFDHDVDVRDAGNGQTSAAVQLSILGELGSTAQTFGLTSPSTGRHSVPNTDWDRFADTPDGRIIAAVTSYPKSAPTDPDLYEADKRLHFSHLLPKTPSTAPDQWQPMAVQLLSPNSVLRSTNAWTGSGAISISGGDFTVTGSGATATRSLNSKWRAWNTPGDPAYHAEDNWTTTKADFYGDGNQDVWGWSLYSYLDVMLTCSVAASLTLTVTIAVVQPNGSVQTFDRSYPLSFASGTSTERVDLLFPQEADSQPCYIERVDAVALSGFTAGSYTVEGMALIADQPARVKVAARGGWTGLLVTQDGSFPASQWGDDPQIGTSGVYKKNDEDGRMQTDGGVDYYGGCVRMDGSLEATCAEWNRMEGVTCLYDGAVMEAGLVDANGNRIGFVDGAVAPAVPQAAWLHNQLPALSVPANTLTHFPASVRCDTLAICPMPAGFFKACIRGNLGMVLEAVVATSDGKRAPAGRQVQARRRVGGSPADSDPVMGSAVTDGAGYVEIPVRTGAVASVESVLYLQGV